MYFSSILHIILDEPLLPARSDSYCAYVAVSENRKKISPYLLDLVEGGSTLITIALFFPIAALKTNCQALQCTLRVMLIS